MADLIDGPCPYCATAAAEGLMVCPECAQDPTAWDDTPPAPARPGSERQPAASAVRRGRQVLLVLPNHAAVRLVDGEPIGLGRETDRKDVNDAVCDFLDVSREHAIVEYRDGVVHVTRDRAPQRSVIAIESQLVAQAGVAEVGQRLRLGTHCWFRVVEA